jgi:NDP-sugar pyrophosphorylase family protein
MDGDTYWIDAGTPATYLAANLDLLDGHRGHAEAGVHPDAEVDGAVVTAVVGAGARIAEGAIVSGSVVLPGATIGRGARVQDAIVGARAVIGAGAELTGGTVVGDEEVVPDGAVLVGVRVPEED